MKSEPVLVHCSTTFWNLWVVSFNWISWFTYCVILGNLLYNNNEVVGGYYIGFTPSIRPSVCPCVRPASRVRSVAPTVLVGSIWYLHILSSNFSKCVMCKVSCKIGKFEFLAIFQNLQLWLCLVLTWDLMWITSMGNHGGGGGGISERRRSSCSGLIWGPWIIANVSNWWYLTITVINSSQQLSFKTPWVWPMWALAFSHAMLLVETFVSDFIEIWIKVPTKNGQW